MYTHGLNTPYPIETDIKQIVKPYTTKHAKLAVSLARGPLELNLENAQHVLRGDFISRAVGQH